MLLPSLISRSKLVPESISEFRLAARDRFEEAIELAAAGHRTGAIYLWGYAAEMTLKAAYFSLIGFDDSKPIERKLDLTVAIHRASKAIQGVTDALLDEERGHNVRAWAELLVQVRADDATKTPYAARFGREIQTYGQRIEQLWRVTLRYRHVDAYFCEVVQMHEAVRWFLDHAEEL
jgi:hypothetical protein